MLSWMTLSPNAASTVPAAAAAAARAGSGPDAHADAAVDLYDAVMGREGVGRPLVARAMDRVDARVDPRDPKYYAPRARPNPLDRVKTYIENRTGRQGHGVREEVNLLDTFLYMRTRAWKRYVTNFRWGTAKFAAWWFWFYLIFVIIFVVVRTEVVGEPEFDHILVIVLLSVIVAYGAPRAATLYKILLTEFYFGFYLYFLLVKKIDGTQIVLFGDLPFFVLLITPLVMLITVVVFFAWPQVFYKLKKVKFRKFAQKQSFRVEERPMEQVDTYTAELLSSHFQIGERSGIRRLELFNDRMVSTGCVPRERSSLAMYVGPIRDGKPHGLGHWIDKDDTGENLVGYFHNGIPVGPFESQENGAITRSLLINIRIGYMSNGHKQLKLQRVRPVLGVASCECSVSGEVLLGYPKEGDAYPASPCDCGSMEDCTCMQVLLARYFRHIDDTKKLSSVVVGIDESGQSLTVTGHRTRRKHKLVKDVTIRVSGDEEDPTQSEAFPGVPAPTFLSVDGAWKSSTDTEAVVYICGYKHTRVDCVRRFGQFLAMAHLPTYMKPFFFHWPNGGWAMSYKGAIGVAKSEQNQIDFEHFLISLRNAGIRNVSFMLHSMGARVFLYSWHRTRRLFSLSPKDTNGNENGTGGLAIESTESSATILTESTMRLSNLVLLSPDYEVDTFEKDITELQKYCGQITLYVDRRDTATKYAQVMRGFRRSLGFNFEEIHDTDGNLADMDIVETTDLQGNVAGTYHSYWNINRQMVDDIHDLLVLQKRAKGRSSRLLRVAEGIYRFLQTPHAVIEV